MPAAAPGLNLEKEELEEEGDRMEDRDADANARCIVLEVKESCGGSKRVVCGVQ